MNLIFFIFSLYIGKVEVDDRGTVLEVLEVKPESRRIKIKTLSP